MTVEIVSHRGGALLWPENSLAAFRETSRLPLEMAECDVHPSRDGEPVVIHDATLDRTTEARGPVSDLEFAGLTRLRLRGGWGETVPSLAAVAALLAPTALRLQVEVKADPAGRPYPGLLEATLRVLDAAGLRGRSGIIAFDAAAAAAARAAGGLDHVAWLVAPALLRSVGAQGVLAVARAHGLAMVETAGDALDANAARRLREGGLRVGVWGANDADGILRAMELGLDALATDDPVLALRLRQQREARGRQLDPPP